LLKDWVLRYGGGAQLFLCQAEDLSHAVEQCHSAYPNEAVVSAQLNEIVLTTVQCWDSPLYKGDGPETDATYDINIVDRRRTSGQLSIDFERQGSQVEDNMIINLEVNRLPDDINPVQCLHLGFDADSIAMSVFKMGDRYILRPEADTELSLTPLPNGEYAYALVRCNAHEPLKVPDGAATGEDEFGPQDNEQHGSATEHGTESTRVRLTLDVDYDLHGLSIEEMQRRLCQMVERAIGQGMLTGQSGATVDQYSMETEVLLLEPV
jgi:hypothetical protein